MQIFFPIFELALCPTLHSMLHLLMTSLYISFNFVSYVRKSSDWLVGFWEDCLLKFDVVRRERIFYVQVFRIEKSLLLLLPLLLPPPPPALPPKL